MLNVAIIGSGISALGAAYRLHENGLKPILYDKNGYYGGHTASFSFDSGFVFDDGPHISFTKDERIQKLFAESVNQEYEEIQVQVNNYWKGHWIKHPAQCNLFGLPSDLIVDVINDFVRVRNNGSFEIENYKDWLYAQYGETFSETFPMKYGHKYHTTTADNMSTDWLGPRMYVPDLKEVLRGALSPTTPEVHYVTHFRYPRKGGFQSFLNLFIDVAEIQLNHKVVEIAPKTQTIRFEKGVAVNYDRLISSMPLPELIKIIKNVPDDVREASEKLVCTQCVVVNIGVNRADLSDYHWTYFYDDDIFFTRVSYPHMQSTNNVPDGCGSIQVECYYSNKYRPLGRSIEDCIEPVIADLKRCGILKERDEILFKEARRIPYANIIFDLDRKIALKTVHGFLEGIGILCCGRYGEWGYHWTDESFITGENASQKILDTLDSNCLHPKILCDS